MAESPVKPNQRIATRLKIFQPGEMYAGGAVTRVHLLDLSCTGALLHAESPPPPGGLVRLACPLQLGAARVVWRRGKRFGVAFATPLRPDMVDAVISRAPSLPGVRALSG